VFVLSFLSLSLSLSFSPARHPSRCSYYLCVRCLSSLFLSCLYRLSVFVFSIHSFFFHWSWLLGSHYRIITDMWVILYDNIFDSCVVKFGTKPCIQTLFARNQKRIFLCVLRKKLFGFGKITFF
jgi:hypothetical protein